MSPLYVVIKLGQATTVTYAPGRNYVNLNTDLSNVPYCAARSLLRMFIALLLSTAFTFVYGTAAARLRRAEKGWYGSSTCCSRSRSWSSSRWR